MFGSIYLKEKRGQISLLGLVITLAIICFLAYVLFNAYFKMPSAGGKIGKSVIMPEVATPSVPYHSIVNDTRSTLQRIEREHQKQLDSARQP
jgi:hypothetical protein